MTVKQFLLPIAHELIVDLFAGGGGASTGIEMATGRHVDIAVNHDPEAISLHEANHPQTKHYVSDVFEVDPLVVCGDQPIGLLWASPDCKHFSKAKGGKPVSKKIRGLAGVVIKWAELKRPRVICLENVEEFKTWGPLLRNRKPCPERKGQTFDRWKQGLVKLGYAVEHRELRGCDYGAPTIRKRLFVIARCDGQPIVWPEPTHAAIPRKGSGLLPYRTAADCIDWSLECPSIFERKKDLAPATLRRIAHGIKRYVFESQRPFIVPVTHQGDNRVHSIDEPVRTITSAKRGELSVVAPTLIQAGYGEREGQAPRSLDLHKPLGTIVGAKKHALVTAFLAKHYGGEPQAGKTCTGLDKPVPTVTASDHSALVMASLVGAGGPAYAGKPADVDRPMGTVTTENHKALVTSNLVKLRGTSNSAATDEPLGTVSAGGNHHGEVRAFLIRYFGTDQDPRIDAPLGTITTKHRDAVVTVAGDDYVIADIGMRMLQPRELYRAQGFPESYQIDRGADGRVLTKEAQVRMCGNSVCPPVAMAIVAANFIESDAFKVAA